jgi:signal transduction histidine kinase
LFLNSLIGRVVIFSFLLFSVAIGAVTFLHIHREHQHIMTSSQKAAELMLTVIERSVDSSMASGDSRDVQAIFEDIGHDPLLLAVRIFHPDGRILNSADPDEIGQSVNPHDLATFRSGEESTIFDGPQGAVLGVVRPIHFENRCAGCHRADEKVIGVLNVDFSLGTLNDEMINSSQFFVLSMLCMITLLTGGISFIIHRFVCQPLRTIADKMAQVEAGDLSAQFTSSRRDEVGRLMLSFDSMVGRLRQANQELNAWHNQQMERVDRLASVGEMSAGIAHEIKNPLAAISGAITVLASDFPEEDPRRSVVSKVLEQIARLDKAATDLLYFGKPGKPSFDLVDTNELLKKTLFFVAQHPEAHNIHQVKEFTRDLPPVWVDEKQLQQVFFNVIINAIQAMKGGGTLLLQTELVDKDDRNVVRVLVGDSGPGIPAETLQKIFTPFFTTKTQGTGLGLAICRQLMEQQGGTIDISSRSGNGTRVTLELPVRLPDGYQQKRN